MTHTVVDRSVLAGRIQGFGNVNPPPLEEETGGVIAKKAVGRLGDMLGEEVMLTVEDFKEKGAVGAVKDAVADAGDILIDGVSGIIGWIRGDAPVEEDNEASEDATKALSNGPAGAAYGISQASPTGGINAVWVMPDEADPAALAQLSAQQQGGLPAQQPIDPRVPKNIQPYQPAQDPRIPKNIQPYQPDPLRNMAPAPNSALQLPGGPVIAPYEPAPTGPSGVIPPFVPLPSSTVSQSKWGPGGYNPTSLSTASSVSSGSTAGGTASGAKGLVERVSKGDMIVGADVAKRLLSQCAATNISAKQLGEIICERAKRLYLGLDGGDPADADLSILRLLGLTDELAKQGTDLSKGAVDEIRKGVSEEFSSLRSNAKHKDAAEPMLKRLLDGGASAPVESVDLLGSTAAVSSASSAVAATPEVDLLDGGAVASSAPAPNVQTTDLLGTAEASVESSGVGAKPASSDADLLGSLEPSAGIDSLDPMIASSVQAHAPAESSASAVLAGLSLDTAAPASPQVCEAAAPKDVEARPPIDAAAAAALAALSAETSKKPEDAFGFVGTELSNEEKRQQQK